MHSLQNVQESLTVLENIIDELNNIVISLRISGDYDAADLHYQFIVSAREQHEKFSSEYSAYTKELDDLIKSPKKRSFFSRNPDEAAYRKRFEKTEAARIESTLIQTNNQILVCANYIEKEILKDQNVKTLEKIIYDLQNSSYVIHEYLNLETPIRNEDILKLQHECKSLSKTFKATLKKLAQHEGPGKDINNYIKSIKKIIQDEADTACEQFYQNVNPDNISQVVMPLFKNSTTTLKSLDKLNNEMKEMAVELRNLTQDEEKLQRLPNDSKPRVRDVTPDELRAIRKKYKKPK